MARTLFIIPGFHNQTTDDKYTWLKQYAKVKGFSLMLPTIDWKRKVMTDYVKEFTDFYTNHKSDTNYVLGFSYGAMIAYISAPELKPDKLFLCSLSGYFAEDLHLLKPSWIANRGHRRIDDFKNYSAKSIAKRITSPTVIFYGEKEAKNYPNLKNRCEEAARDIQNAKLVEVPQAPHEIAFPSYMEAIKSELR